MSANENFTILWAINNDFAECENNCHWRTFKLILQILIFLT